MLALESYKFQIIIYFENLSLEMVRLSHFMHFAAIFLPHKSALPCGCNKNRRLRGGARLRAAAE